MHLHAHTSMFKVQHLDQLSSWTAASHLMMVQSRLHCGRSRQTWADYCSSWTFFLFVLFWQSWPIFSQQPLIVGLFSLIAAEVQLCRTLCSLTSERLNVGSAPGRPQVTSLPPPILQSLLWSRQSFLDLPVVHQSLKFQTLFLVSCFYFLQITSNWHILKGTKFQVKMWARVVIGQLSISICYTFCFFVLCFLALKLFFNRKCIFQTRKRTARMSQSLSMSVSSMGLQKSSRRMQPAAWPSMTR